MIAKYQIYASDEFEIRGASVRRCCRVLRRIRHKYSVLEIIELLETRVLPNSTSTTHVRKVYAHECKDINTYHPDWRELPMQELPMHELSRATNTCEMAA
jgi:hypothetical protein